MLWLNSPHDACADGVDSSAFLAIVGGGGEQAVAAVPRTAPRRIVEGTWRTARQARPMCPQAHPEGRST